MIGVEESIEKLKRRLLRLDNLEEGASEENRIKGLDWPKEAETMIGLKRMENIEYCIDNVINDDIPGDMIEAGVWRGGACIFMRGILKAYEITDRKVYVADSFKGFPKPTNIMDEREHYIDNSILCVSRKEVESNFEKYGLLDEQVEFVEGYFANTLSKLQGPFSIVRLDGDLFQSTLDGLEGLYHKLSVGGYLIIDDYNEIVVCKVAVELFRARHNIVEDIINIDRSGVYWKKERECK